MAALRGRGFVYRAILASLAVGVLTGLFSAQAPPEALAARTPFLPRRCGTSTARHLLGVRPPALSEVVDGEPLGFDQDPSLVFPDHRGPITLRNFEIAGDFPIVQFRRFDPDSSGEPEEWERLTSRTVAGRVISIFEPRWTDGDLAKALSRTTFGFDDPQIFWGTLEIPDTSITRQVFLRMALNGIPSSSVVRLNDRVQYASNVVNLAIPGFGDTRVAGGTDGFELQMASRMFFQYFADTYDVLAFIPQRVATTDFFGFHQNVQNAVRGLNIPIFDQSPSYGSAGVLQGVEVYTDSAIARYDIVNHEMAHQWGSNLDWTRITGIARAGVQPSSHAPLWTGGETLLGAVLNPERRVRTAADGYEIERTPAPVHYHPIEMYSMGAIGADQVLDFQVFTEQGQFDPDHATSPEVGTRVTGEARTVTMLDIVREHGAREGSVPTRWRRATVLVSRDALASQREMDYWNFFAQRHADRNAAVRPSIEGHVPFHRAAYDATSLTTAILPLEGDSLAEALNVESPAFATTDWRDVEFLQGVPTVFQIGEPVTLSGRVRTTDDRDFDQIGIVFFRPDVPDPVSFYGEIRRSGDFSVTVRFTAAQQGRYSVGVFLFWPDSGSQYARTYLSSVSVEGLQIAVPPHSPWARRRPGSH